MPTFSASTVPSVVGLYVDKFIDPSGRLSNLVILSGGSGYSSSNPPTITITGGGGTGAQVLPSLIVNGQIVGVEFYDDPNLGDLRGSNYTSIPTFTFVGGGGSGAAMTCSLSQNTTILGVPANENSLLEFCLDHNVNYLALYNMRFMNWASNSSTSISSPGMNMLANFIAKARTSGITEVGAVTSASASDVNNIMGYHNTRSSSTMRFDWLNLEKEYWNGDGDINIFISRLDYMRQQATGGTPYPLKVEVYLGWPTYSDMMQMIPRIDRLLLHDYSSTNVPDYNYTRSRLRGAISSACTDLNTTLDLMPIFSAERKYSPWNASYEFMGLYYTGETVYSAWYNWGVAPGGYVYGTSNLGSFNNESNAQVRTRINPIGHIVFQQSFLRTSNPPTLPPYTPYITANGPLTFNSGQSVILTAEPNSFEYYWQPFGQTGQTITATTSGNYTVTATNFSGVTGISTAVTVTVLSATCQADISYSGSSTFYSGGTLVLSANSGSSYYWLPNGETTQTINVTESGNYQVQVSNGSGCTGTSQVLSVTVNPCQTTITPSGSISATTGDSVTLYADPNALSYLWSPNGETTQSINVVSGGSYSVQVNYGTGCSPSSPATDVYFFSCVANISYEGSTTLISGQTIVLSASTADAYLWSPNGETTQTISVQQPGNYSVMTYQAGINCSAYSESVTINAVVGKCVALIQASGPLYYSSGLTTNSVTLSANTGVSYLWSPGGETTQTIVVTGSGTYSVLVDNGFGCVASSSIILAGNSYNPLTGYWSEDFNPAVLNSYLTTAGGRTKAPWTNYNVNLTNPSSKKYYVFINFRSKNGRNAGVRFGLNDNNDFFPIIGKKNTSFGWYRLEAGGKPFAQIVPNQQTKFFLQPINNNTEIKEVAISSDPNFISGPYPNYSSP
jgi:hypothetical protein